MIASFYKKALTVISLVALLLAFCLNVYAESVDLVSAEAEMVYFDYSDGIVRDGARHDREGIIGDEFEWEKNVNRSSRSADNVDVRSTERAESESRAVTFWGIAASLLVIAAVILLIALVTPKKENGNNRK